MCPAACGLSTESCDVLRFSGIPLFLQVKSLSMFDVSLKSVVMSYRNVKLQSDNLGHYLFVAVIIFTVKNLNIFYDG